MASSDIACLVVATAAMSTHTHALLETDCPHAMLHKVLHALLQ